MNQLPFRLVGCTRLPDELDSLGTDEEMLQLLKQHCGLPDDESFTERDAFLGMLLDAAERDTDEISGRPYRARNFKLTLPLSLKNYDSFHLGLAPVSSVSSFLFVNDDDEEEEFTDADFRLEQHGNRYFITLPPESSVYTVEAVNREFPFVVEVTTGGIESDNQRKLAILTTASALYRNQQNSSTVLSELQTLSMLPQQVSLL